MPHTVSDFIRDPKLIFFALGHKGLLNWLPDKTYLQLAYRIRMGRKLDLRAPKTFNEKMQWLKLYDRKPEYTTFVDKYEAKKYVAKKIGDEHIIPTLGVWDTFDQINFDKLPDQFVLKCTHDSGGLVIVKDKAKLDIESTRRRINRSLKSNFYWISREWPYKNVKPRIIAETYMTDNNYYNLPVYKVFCFNGVPKVIQTIQNDKQSNESIDYFDTDWNLLELKQNFPNSSEPYSRPNNLDIMIQIAKILSCGHNYIRIDLYSIDNSIYFSEYTFFSDSGLAQFYPEGWDVTLGEWMQFTDLSGSIE